MPDAPTPPPSAGNDGSETPKKKQAKGPFNKEQLAALATATEILTAAQEPDHKAALAKQGITETWLTAFATKVGTANGKVTEAGSEQEDSEEETAEAADSREKLTALLRDLQKAARQKQRMDATDDDPETNFDPSGYFPARLHPNQEGFLAIARALSAKAKADDLPGVGATEIAALDAAIEQHAADLAAQPKGRQDANQATVQRNAAIETITSHRIALQYAADRAYPPGDPITAPARKRFHLDPDKGLAV